MQQYYSGPPIILGRGAESGGCMNHLTAEPLPYFSGNLTVLAYGIAGKELMRYFNLDTLRI